MSEELIGNNIAVIDREKEKEKVKPPPKYAVIFNNDDYTPMDFVTEMLMVYFGKNYDDAQTIMWDVHTKGKGIAGVYTHQIAETKKAQVDHLAQQAGYPLLLTIEPIE